MSGFEADARKRLAKWRNARRRRRNPEWRRTEQEWLREAKQVQSPQSRRSIEEAGFNDPDHYLRDGSAYCRCGTVIDHNRRFDELVGRGFK